MDDYSKMEIRAQDVLIAVNAIDNYDECYSDKFEGYLDAMRFICKLGGYDLRYDSKTRSYEVVTR